LILRLTCPTCNRDTYNPSVESFRACPYCGILFSGKHGTNKRKDSRLKKEIPFVFPYKDQFLEASIINISEKGLGIKIYGRIPLSLGDVLNLSVSGSSVKARIMWASDNPDIFITVMGLQVLDGKLNLS